MFRSIPEGLTATANMMFCIILIAGVVEIYKYINVVGALINSVLKASKRFNSLVIIAIVMIVFFIFGGILGWSEHIIPFVPIIISLAISLGYDALVGMAISGFACLIAFASAPFNMFTVGTSHTIAELPMFSGWELRLVSLGVICLMALLWTLRYARKIKNHPELSLVKDIDNSSLLLPVDEEITFTPVRKLSTLVLAVSIAINIVGLLEWGWSYTHMATSFLIGGVIVALLNRVGLEKSIDLIVDGCTARASSVTIPWKMPTGMAEKRQPRPREALMTQTITISSSALRARVEWSPEMPSWMEPTTAMAPMQTVREAETKPSTNRFSRALPVFTFSQLPNCSIRRSRLIHSPSSDPTA